MADQTITIPKGWKMTTLGDCPYLVYGDGNYSSKYPKAAEFVDVGIPFISNKDITEGKIIATELRYISEKLHSELIKGHIKYGDVLISTRANIGDIGWVDRNFDGANINAQLVFLRSDNENLDPRFLYFLLRSKRYKAIFESYSSGSAQSQLPIHALREIPIIYPSFSEQRAIAAVLSSLDDKIELLREQNKTLEATAQAIFKEWFVNFNFPGASGKMIDSELGEIPEGWRVGIIEELTTQMNSGGTPSTKEESYYNGPINWFSTKELQDNFIFESEKKITELGLKKSSAKLFPKNTVIMAIYAAPTVGRLGILTKESTFNQAAVGFVAKNEIGYEFVFLMLKLLRDQLNGLANGAAQQNLNVGLVKNFKIIIPDQEILKNFNLIVKSLFEKILNNTFQVETLSKLRDVLLPKLMKGKVRVKGFNK